MPSGYISSTDSRGILPIWTDRTGRHCPLVACARHSNCFNLGHHSVFLGFYFAATGLFCPLSDPHLGMGHYNSIKWHFSGSELWILRTPPPPPRCNQLVQQIPGNLGHSVTFTIFSCQVILSLPVAFPLFPTLLVLSSNVPCLRFRFSDPLNSASLKVVLVL